MSTENIIQKIKRENRERMSELLKEIIACELAWRQGGDILAQYNEKNPLDILDDYLSLAEDNIIKGILEMIEEIRKEKSGYLKKRLEGEL